MTYKLVVRTICPSCGYRDRHQAVTPVQLASFGLRARGCSRCKFRWFVLFDPQPATAVRGGFPFKHRTLAQVKRERAA